MVDAAQFRKINPNYARLSLIRAANSRWHNSNPIDIWFNDGGPPPLPRAVQVKVDDADVDM